MSLTRHHALRKTGKLFWARWVSRLVAGCHGNRASGFDHSLFDQARHLRRRLRAVHSVDPGVPVPLENRTGELAVGMQPVANDGFLIVLAGEQPRTIFVA